MAIGYTVAASVLVSEVVGGCAKKCREFARRNSAALVSIGSNSHPNSSVKRGSDSGQLTPSTQESFRNSIFERFRRRSSTSSGNKTFLSTFGKRHSRHNSLVRGDSRKSSDVTNGTYEANDYDEDMREQNGESERDSSPSPDSFNEVHRVQINRAPTPYNPTIEEEALEDNFGEKVVHLSE